MNLTKNFPVRNIKNIKKYVELLNIKLKNGEFKLTYRSCICCKQNSEKILFNNDRYGINLKILMCKVCGFVYQNPRIDEESLIKFYESDLYRDIHSSVDNYQY